MKQPATRSTWPELPWREWEPTLSTLHMWLQVVGKVPLALSAPLNHWWHIGLRVTASGLTTGPIPYEDRAFQIDLDFVEHRLTVVDGSPGPFSMPLEPRSVASFYRQLLAGLGSRGIDVRIWPHPVEVSQPVPFEQDEGHATYNPAHAQAVWRALAQADQVMKTFQGGFIGKQSPVLLYWGGFDLATSRFSGRAAPTHPGGVPNCPDWVVIEAEAAEQSVAGFWPAGADGPVFFAYAYPEPPGYRAANIRPGDASFDGPLGEFVMSYDAVRLAPNPDAALLEFFGSTYEAAANLGKWDRSALEPAVPPERPPRRAWSIRP